MAVDCGAPRPWAGEDLSAGKLSRLATAVLDDSPFPALVLEVPSERIVASSPPASQLLDPEGGRIVGHYLEEFTADPRAQGVDMFAGGRLNGFESFRVLRRARGADVKVRMWVRTFDHQPSSRFVLVVLAADQPIPGGLRAIDRPEEPAVVGTADARLLIERISSDAESLFGRPVPDLLGGSLTDLIAEQDVPDFSAALSEASANQSGVSLYLDIRVIGADSMKRSLGCEVLILPLHPAPSFAFVFLPTAGGLSRTRLTDDLSTILIRLGRGAEIAKLARGAFSGITERDVPGLSKLTTRELEIVMRLHDGDRTPAIATKLVVSQSTVRNHLASVFGKLGVTSQQELLNLFRAARSATGAR